MNTVTVFWGGLCRVGKGCLVENQQIVALKGSVYNGF